MAVPRRGSTRCLASFLICCSFPLFVSAYTTELTDNDFDLTINDGKDMPWFVMFYMPGCQHCKAIQPVWDKVAERLTGQVGFAAVDATKHRWLSAAYDVSGFPTLKMIANGAVYTYDGTRTSYSLEAFANGGYLEGQKSPLPKDESTTDKVWKMSAFYVWENIIFVGITVIIILVVWCCCIGQSTEADRAKRRAFEARMAELEQKAKEREEQKRANAAQESEKKQHEESEKKPEEEKKED